MSERSKLSITVEFPIVSDLAAKAEFVDRLKGLYIKKLEAGMEEYSEIEEGENHE